MTDRNVEQLLADIERRRQVVAKSEYLRGWNCALEEVEDLVRAIFAAELGVVNSFDVLMGTQQQKPAP
jgi:hypothetical protein